MYVPLSPSTHQDWKGWTLLIPSVSVGNVGQLAMDLLINSCDIDHVGYLHDSSILPVVGNHPLDCHKSQCVITTAAQVYTSDASKRVFVQLRSPLVRGKRQQFVSRLTEWIKSAGFGRVFIITSTHSYERTDAQLTGTQLRWLSSPKLKCEMGEGFIERTRWLVELERREGLESADPSDTHPHIFLPGADYTKKFYTTCLDEDISVGVFLIFCSEGNNSNDAMTLAGNIQPVVVQAGFSSSPATYPSEDPRTGIKITTPSSWKYMFGNTFDQVIF